MKNESIKGSDLKLVVTTFFGLESLLAAELKDLGATEIEIHNRAVSCKGNTSHIYRINYCSRLALRVLYEIASFIVEDATSLYEEAFDVEWERYLDKEGTFTIHSVCSQNENFNNTMFASMRVKDAIADKYRALYGVRPSVNKDNPDLIVSLHIFRNKGTLLIDSSGIPLFQRGYRKQMTEAPLKENMAAAMIFLSGWDKKQILIDPMCGSGTLLIEAAMMATNTPAGFFRRNFAFEKWINFDRKLFSEIKNEANSLRNSAFLPVIKGYDISVKAVSIARENLITAGFQELVQINRQDFYRPDSEISDALLVFNPPYGERLKQNDITSFYKEIGNTLKKYYSGCKACILSPVNDDRKFIGLHASRNYRLFNGKIECSFKIYELYKGSKKSMYSNPD